MLQAKLSNGLASLLLIARVDGNVAACWHADIAITSLNLGVGAVARVFDLGDLLVWLVFELFNAWVRHIGVLALIENQL